MGRNELFNERIRAVKDARCGVTIRVCFESAIKHEICMEKTRAAALWICKTV